MLLRGNANRNIGQNEEGSLYEKLEESEHVAGRVITRNLPG